MTISSSFSQSSPLGLKISKAVEDGKITQDEFEELKGLVNGLDLPDSEKESFVKIVDKVKEYTNLGLFNDGVLERSEMAKLEAMAEDLKGSELASAFFDAFKAKASAQTDNSPLASFFQSLFSVFKPDEAGSDSFARFGQPQSQSVGYSRPGTGPLSSAPAGAQSAPAPEMSLQDDWDDPQPASPLTQPGQAADDPDCGCKTDETPDFAQVHSGEIYQRSPYHDDSKFVPAFSMTAYHESGCYRSASDPYAVGAISRPSRSQDKGGKTYGCYQFESSVYANGSTAGRNAVQGSTLMRFVNSPQNPFGPQLREAIQKYGVASAGFDRVWQQLATQQNKAFGEAQQQFMLSDTAARVEGLMDKAELSEEARQDSRIADLLIGTANQVGGLANGVAEHIASRQRQLGRKMTADEVGVAICDYKKSRINSWFQSSPGAWAGVRNRYNEERTLFT